MGIRVAVWIGQYPMGLEQPSTGTFVGSGPTPIGALLDAAERADTRLYREDNPMNPKRVAALAIFGGATGEPTSDEYLRVFKGEDAYNCRIVITERKEKPRGESTPTDSRASAN